MPVKLSAWKIAGSVAIAICLGCGQAHQSKSEPSPVSPTPVTKPAPATPLDAKKVELGGETWNPQWDLIVEDALPPSLLSREVPRGVRHFCPRFYELSNADKRAFWAYFFEALAGAEAGLDPTTHVHHTEAAVDVRDGVTHELVRSEGLLQLTYEDEKRYGCNFDWAADRKLKPGDPARTILQPKNNLDCGVKILTRQIIENGEPLLSRHSYWSTLQPGTESYRVFAKQMTNPPLACGLHVRARVAPKRPSASRESAER